MDFFKSSIKKTDVIWPTTAPIVKKVNTRLKLVVAMFVDLLISINIGLVILKKIEKIKTDKKLGISAR